MGSYTVTAVSDSVRDWSTKSGVAWKSYRVTLRNAEGRELGNVEVSRPATAPKPEAGQTVEGTIEQTEKFGPKLQEPRKGGTGGGGRAKPPEERRSIAMQSSAQRGVDIVRLAIDAGAWKPESVNDVAKAAIAAADKVYDRVMQAEKGSA